MESRYTASLIFSFGAGLGEWSASLPDCSPPTPPGICPLDGQLDWSQSLSRLFFGGGGILYLSSYGN